MGDGERERERERNKHYVHLHVCTSLHRSPFQSRCVITELFVDGRPLFDLSQLLEYYSKEEATELETTLKKIPDRFIRVSGIGNKCQASSLGPCGTCYLDDRYLYYLRSDLPLSVAAADGS